MDKRQHRFTDERGCVVVKASDGAGLGDRLLAVASAIGYSLLTGRKLVVDWRDGLYSPKGDNAFDQFFQLHGIPHAMEFPPVESVAPHAWQARLDMTLSDLVDLYSAEREWNRDEAHTLYSIDQSRTDYDEDAVVIWDYEQFEGIRRAFIKSTRSFRLHNDFALRRHLLQSHLALQTGLQQNIDEFVNSHFERAVIGVHIRATREGESRYTSPEVFRRFINFLWQSGKAGKIFLASDNIEIVKEFESSYDVVTTPKWYPAPGDPMHLHRNSADRMQGLKEALMDLILLSRCQYILYSAPSSFGQVAALLGSFSWNQIYALDNAPRCQSVKVFLRRRLKDRLMRLFT